MRPQEEIDAEIAALRSLVSDRKDVSVAIGLAVEILSDDPSGLAAYAVTWKHGGGDKPLSLAFVEMGLAKKKSTVSPHGSAGEQSESMNESDSKEKAE